ncbi:PepSY domain-containing protein [Eilatimonas milleporae]|uniref:Peptidase YpeB-like protein n=1 Tax=Eilatimonas milleporae TaxID=911205 RepID=A0A3M0CM36_9PROT|nr:PepSY domain-containing protein [Eilatimonas milleporae]RMB08119.1 peptidase YpeB-like protein [Eilatimonas milleporae]
MIAKPGHIPIRGRRAGLITGLILGLILGLSAGVAAQDISLAKFIDGFERDTGGRVYEIERERKDGRIVYDIESVRGDRIMETVVDAATGQVLSEEAENTALWTPISADKKRALMDSPATLGRLMLADSRLSGKVAVRDIAARLGKGGLLFVVTTENDGRIILTAGGGEAP